ncbi:hypothetical protein SAY87_031427 [Trapa incisa]|uniref:Uncharacterized protein n=2 Tax=Trapa TaxID=22665 RepID=A0AAN7RCR3_TRANT|nr:hypothetical protein SAY87_031427 [Trapa incisa]KAK4796715.1 hypothetical protein SAY86_029041 [Trapa natans]
MEVYAACMKIAASSAPGLGCTMEPYGAMAAARVSCKINTIHRSRRRTKRRLHIGRDLGGEDNFWYYLVPGGFGPIDGGGSGFNGGQGGGGRNSGWFGGHSWGDEPSFPPRRISGFAADFFHEVVSWIALSECLHFAFKKVVRAVA